MFLKIMQLFKILNDDVDECAWVHGELKSVLGLQNELVSLKLPGTGVSLSGEYKM
jgi:hypothetical protein